METLIGLLREIRPEFDFDASEDFIEDGIFDSLDIINLVSAIDKKFDVSIAGNDIVPENFRNLASIAELIRRNRGEV